MARVLAIQPYIPTYRIPLFRYLRNELPRHGIEFRVAAASPTGLQAERGDAVPTEGDFHIDQSLIRLGSSSIQIRRIGEVIRRYHPDMIIIEQAIKNLESWQLLVKASRRPPLVGMWGQGAPFSQNPSPATARLKTTMTNRAQWFFAYTNAGAEFVASEGFPKDRITVVRNSTDTGRLRTDIQSISEQQLREFRDTHNLTQGKTALFMGGIDSRKGLGFLIQSVQRIQESEPAFRLLVAGAGSDVETVRNAMRSGLAIDYLGRLEGAEKALPLAVSDFIMLPEWVGLIATDALASGRPVVTTSHHSHAPEFAYLSEGAHRLSSAHVVDDYATLVIGLMRDPRNIKDLQAQCYAEGFAYSIEGMGEHFIEGIRKWAARDLRVM